MIFRRHLNTLAVILGMMVATPVFAADTNPQTGVAQPKNERETTTKDAQQRRLVVGTWEDDYQGKRTMTLKEDGTGTMIVDLKGVKAALFASRLTFNMKWSVEKGRLKKRTIGGTPSGRVQMILKMMGDRVDEPILELTDKQLLLLDKDGKTKYDWRRVR